MLSVRLLARGKIDLSENKEIRTLIPQLQLLKLYLLSDCVVPTEERKKDGGMGGKSEASAPWMMKPSQNALGDVKKKNAPC